MSNDLDLGHHAIWERKIREAVQNDARSTDELVSAAKHAFVNRFSDDDALFEAYHGPLRSLRFRADPSVVEAAGKLIESPDNAERIIASDILGEIHLCNENLQIAAADILICRFRTELDPEVLASIVRALGRNGDKRFVREVCALHTHPDVRVRSALTCNLAGNDEEIAVATLITLTTDSETEVRDWATFALGSQTDLDTPELRNALAARLEDENMDVQWEAFAGLARRGDRRVIPAMLIELEAWDTGSLRADAKFVEAANAAAAFARDHGGEEWLQLTSRLNAANIGEVPAIWAEIEKSISNTNAI